MTLFPAERRLPAILADAVRYLRALSAMTHLDIRWSDCNRPCVGGNRAVHEARPTPRDWGRML